MHIILINLVVSAMYGKNFKPKKGGRMKRIFILFFFLVIFFVVSDLSFAETDILGWGKTKWGMTHSQVAKLYNLDKWEKDKPNRCFLKKKVAIQGHKFNVVFFFDKRSSSGKLSMVALVSINKNAKNNKIFDSVFGLYVGKYGKPDSSKTIGTSTKVNLWFRPSGQIEYGLFANGPFVMCSIDYVAVKSESDKI